MVLANCHQQGVIVMSAGPQRNVVCLLPPLVTEKDLLREGLHDLASSIIEEATRIQVRPTVSASESNDRGVPA